MDAGIGTPSDHASDQGSDHASVPDDAGHGDALRGWLIGLELALAVMACGGAASLIAFGAGMPDTTIDRFPFGSAVLGGIALLLVNGVLPAVVAVGELRRAAWARVGHLVVGAALMFWVMVQIGFIGLDSFLQPTLFVWGALITSLGILRGRDSWPVADVAAFAPRRSRDRA
jgi:hypothetical protein